MTQRNEKELVDARKAFYETAKVDVNMLEIGEFAGNMTNNLHTLTNN